MGLTGFYRKFVKHYTSIVALLMELLKKDSFSWTHIAHLAFDNLKYAMSTTLVLALPDFEQVFILETDASGVGMRAVLMQHNHPINFFSKKFCPKLLLASTYVRELHAIIIVVKKWRTYLLGRKFSIHTDQRSLKELMTQVIQTSEQQYYLAKLLGYIYEIVFKPSSANRVADTLSRVHETSETLLGLTIPHFTYVDKLKELYSIDPKLSYLVAKVQQQPTQHSHFQMKQGILFYKGKIFLTPSSSFCSLLLDEFHCSSIGGHAGIRRMYGCHLENFYWKDMKTNVVQFVSSCLTFQLTKTPTHRPYGLLQPLPILIGVWKDVSIILIIGLPSFQGHMVIFVVVNHFSKAVYFGMFPTSFTAARVAGLFGTLVCELHGMPRSIFF